MKFLNKILDNYLPTNDLKQNKVLRHMNEISLICVIILLIHLFYFIYFTGFSIITKIQGVTTLFFIYILVFKKQTKYYNKIDVKFFVLLSYIVLLTHIYIGIFYSYNYYEDELYYFPILTSLILVFDFKKDLTYVISIVSYCIFLIIINHIFDFHIDIEHEKIAQRNINDMLIKLTTILFNIFAILVCIYVIYINKIEFKELENKANKLIDINNELIRKNKTSTPISKKDIEELITCAKINSPLFYDKFNHIYPHFLSNLVHNDKNVLNHNEILFSFLLKLNFNTKEIAQILNITVRAVESKKYRIKKKLEVNTSEELPDNLQEYLLTL